MTNNIRKYIRPYKTINNMVDKGYEGVIKVRREITFKCNIEDDDDKIHSIIMHMVNDFPEAPIYLLSP